jgi:uncharacterized protein
MSLQTEDKKKLLTLARRLIESYLHNKKNKNTDEKFSQALQENRGAFVTLEKNGNLRGCIGSLVADRPLFQVVQEMAIQAAIGDPRFSPLALDELVKIEIEISVLFPFKKILDVSEIKVGEHGLLVVEGEHRGLLLPQVARREGWSEKIFLSHTCLKAGLPQNRWQKKGLEIFIFSSNVFSEKDFKK